MIGPSLFGVMGRRAGEVQGFHYTAAMKNSGLTWNTNELGQYIANPHQVVPQTAMTYAGLKDAQKRADLIAYLASLH